MTYEEAIEVLRWAINRLEGHHYIIDDNGTVDPSAKVNAFGMAIEALEKQTPKKPYWEYGVWHCKSCGFDVFRDDFFCHICGQEIDWEDDE